MDEDKEFNKFTRKMLVMVGIINVISLPISLPVMVYRGLKRACNSLKDLKYRKDRDVTEYPTAEDLHDFEMRRMISGSPECTTWGVGEISLDSGETLVYSVISDYRRPSDKLNSIEINGYKLSSRKIRKIPKDEKEQILPEIRNKLGKVKVLERITEFSI